MVGNLTQLFPENLTKLPKWNWVRACGLLFLQCLLSSFFSQVFIQLSLLLSKLSYKILGDYSQFTLKWWIKSTSGGEKTGCMAKWGFSSTNKFGKRSGGSLKVALISAVASGTIGLLVGYAVSKQRKGKLAGYVNSVSFLPYLLPSLAVGAAYFVFSKQIGLWGTYTILIIVGTINISPLLRALHYPQCCKLAEIEEAAYIQKCKLV